MFVDVGSITVVSHSGFSIIIEGGSFGSVDLPFICSQWTFTYFNRDGCKRALTSASHLTAGYFPTGEPQSEL